jgi:hypothetical protein
MNHWNQKHWDYDSCSLLLEDPEMRWKATVKPDGCFELYRAFNTPFQTATNDMVLGDLKKDIDCDSIHICDVDDLIERLQSLKAQAIKHYGPKWPY